MTRRRSRLVGTTVIVVVATLLYLLLIGLSIGQSGQAFVAIAGDEATPRVGLWAIWTVYLLYALVGGLVLRHSARNSIGIFVAVMGMIPLLGNLAGLVVANGAPHGLLGDLVAWIILWYFDVFLGAFVALFHVFPTGRTMPGVWRWWYRIALFGAGSLVFTNMFGPPQEGDVNPFEIPIEVAGIEVFVFPALLIGFLSGVISLGVRYRQSHHRERDQLKWFFFSVIVAVVVFFGLAISGEGLGWIPIDLAEKLAIVAFPLPALGILIAVTRHGLFDIDRIVSRTVSYATIGLVVVAVYVVPVVALPEVLGLSSDLAVALATLAAAAVFSPLRRRVQSWVDRRFNRERYDAERVVAAFSGKLQTAVDLGRVTDELGMAVSAALHPTAVSVWFGEPGFVTVPERPSERMA